MEYKYSRAIDTATLTQLAPKAFTTLPVRIHENDSQVRKLSREFVEQWRSSCKNDDTAASSYWQRMGLDGGAGHVTSLCVCEMTPQMQSFWVKAMEYIGLDDGMSHTHGLHRDKYIEWPNNKWADIILVGGSRKEINIGAEKPITVVLSNDPGIRRMQYSLALELADELKDITSSSSSMRDLLESGSMYWNTRRASFPACKTLDEYILARYNHFPTRVIDDFIHILLPGVPTLEERKTVDYVIEPLRATLYLVADYFSYAKEKTANDRPMINAVHLLMENYSVTEEEAMSRVKTKILELEEEHTAAFEQLKGKTSNAILAYIDFFRLFAAGNHVWCASAKRYHGDTFMPGYFLGNGMVSRIWGWIAASLSF